jgi:DNA-binding CsgD family transcriptional regulator
MNADYEKLVGSIYDCAANPELWPTTLAEIRDAVGGAYALVGYIDTSSMSMALPPFVVRRNSEWDEEWLVKLEGLLKNVPNGAGMVDNGLDTAWTQLQQTPESEFQTTDFYKHWVEPQGLRDTINTPYLLRPSVAGMLSVPSFASREPYGEEECRLMERLSPHIRRAMMINDVADKGKMATTLYRQVLDTLSVAVFVVGLGRRLVFTNTKGDALLREDSLLVLSNNMLQAKRPSGSDTTLEGAIERAIKGDLAIGISGIGVPLLGKNGDRAAAYVLPITGQDVRGAMGPGMCTVFVAKRNEHQPMAIEVLRTLFDLTASEARVAVLIAQGNSPLMISEALSISVNTVRSHLKHIYAKADVPDLTGLSGLVNALLPPL